MLRIDLVWAALIAYVFIILFKNKLPSINIQSNIYTNQDVLRTDLNNIFTKHNANRLTTILRYYNPLSYIALPTGALILLQDRWKSQYILSDQSSRSDLHCKIVCHVVIIISFHS